MSNLHRFFSEASSRKQILLFKIQMLGPMFYMHTQLMKNQNCRLGNQVNHLSFSVIEINIIYRRIFFLLVIGNAENFFGNHH